jgi:hypothetical protein
VYVSSDLNIDLGRWLSNAKMLVPVLEIMKIPSQREKLLRAIDCPSQKSVDPPPSRAYQDASVILQNMDRGNENNRPFYLCLLVNDFILHNCMLDSKATSNVMTKKVMEQLNLRISRTYHNIRFHTQNTHFTYVPTLSIKSVIFIHLKSILLTKSQ